MADDVLVLPESGKKWRWRGGVVPPLCRICQDEPAIATYENLEVGWGCLKVLDYRDRKNSER